MSLSSASFASVRNRPVVRGFATLGRPVHRSGFAATVRSIYACRVPGLA